MSKSKTVQIDERLFFDLCDYFLDEDDTVDLDYIKSALKVKYEHVMAHKYYTFSKDETLSEETREMYRQKYLDIKGIREDFRW